MNTRPYVSNGNSKVKCLIFNLPSVITCKSCLECYKYCYARKAEIQYKQVLPCRTRNLKSSQGSEFTSDMLKLLSKKRCKVIRIHGSGDFYNKEYILKWYEVCNRMPDRMFYAYTKRDDLFNEELLNIKPLNLTLIFSIDKIQSDLNHSIPEGFDSIATVHNTESTCPAQLNEDIKCIKNCRKCLNKGETICFKKH